MALRELHLSSSSPWKKTGEFGENKGENMCGAKKKLVEKKVSVVCGSVGDAWHSLEEDGVMCANHQVIDMFILSGSYVSSCSVCLSTHIV
jgi:hypothetical protein